MRGFFSASLGFLVALSANAADFKGAVPQPIGKVDESPIQLQIRFPEGIAQKDAFQVSCSPEVKGFSSWADNNTLWTYNFKADQEFERPQLAGGTKCEVKQIADVKSLNGATTWKAGTIDYSVVVNGPNVTNVYPASGFQGSLRENDPVMMITFNGPVDREKFFAEGNGYLSYSSGNAPGEKIQLVPVPQDKQEELFKYFKNTRYVDAEYKDGTWILATAKQNLIPGAKVTVNVQDQASSLNRDVRSNKKFTEELEVRQNFLAEIQCANTTRSDANCLPGTPITVGFNGKVKWADVKGAYIEYIPYKSQDNKVVRSYPELDKNQEGGLVNQFLNAVGDYIPAVGKFSDTLVEQITFNVKIEPQTLAKVVLPSDLQDFDKRKLSNPIPEFVLKIGEMTEAIRVTKKISFFEKNQPNLALPVGVVNLNQKLTIRKTGTSAKDWLPIRDIKTIVNIIREYDTREDFRETAEYESPMQKLKLKSTRQELQLTGTKNRDMFLQFPFGQRNGSVGGLYPIEITSKTYETIEGDNENFRNPKYVLAQVTDLAVTVKKGKTQSLAWVTRLSTGQPVAGAQVEIYNCLGDKVHTVAANNDGIATFANVKAQDCNKPDGSWSSYMEVDEVYVVGRTKDDFTLTHTSWGASGSYAYGSPGMEYVFSEIFENEPHFHSIVGVNLVKPGQKVPVQILAKLPQGNGFAEVAARDLPTSARIVSNEDEDIYFDFPLTWNNGSAQLTWQVPAGSSAKIGGYSIQIKKGEYQRNVGDIEVAEFKIPLMSGMIAFPKQSLVKPDAIPVSAAIRYANGVGAKDLPVEISYYFEPTSISVDELAGFVFGTGQVSLTDQEKADEGLPRGNRPARIEGLSTDKAGAISKDLAQEVTADGRLVKDVLKGANRPQKLVARVRYQDQMGEFQTLSQAKDIYNVSEYVGTKLVAGPRAEAKLQAAVLNVDKKIVTALQDLELKVLRVESKTIGEELFGGLIKNTVERELKETRWSPSCALVKQVVVCPVGALKAGTYAFQATSKNSNQAANVLFKVDEEGRVYNNDDYYYFGDDEEKQMALALDKSGYKHGEKATVSFAAPFKACPALVSIERSEVIDAFVVPDACGAGKVEVPVDATLAPNAYVSIYAVTGRAEGAVAKPGERDLGRPTYRIGFANMKIDWGRFKSNVKVTTDKQKYEPGQEVQVQVNVQAEEGQLTNGKVTVVAIEEKILELKKNDSYKILDALMQLRGHNITMAGPLELIETVSNETVGGEKADRKGGDEGGDGSEKAEFKRKLFDALVTFQADVPVVNGVATVKFKSNDSVTRFKVIAIATDASQKFGTGDAVYLTEKDTQSYSNIPSVAHTGDQFPVKVTVQNNTGSDRRYRTEVTATVKDANGNVIDTIKLSREASIENAKSVAVDVGQIAIADNASRIEYVIRVYDENGKVVDVIEPEAQIVHQTVPLTVRDAFIVQAVNGAISAPIVKDEKALAGKGEIRVTLAKSLVTGALKQIVDRMDRDIFADFFIESRLYKALLTKNEAALKSVFNTMLLMTDTKGFLKFAPASETGNLYLTANILQTLEQESWAMKLAPQALVAKWKNAVTSVLTKSVHPDYVGDASPMGWLRAQAQMGRAAYAFDDEQLHDAAVNVSANAMAQLAQNPNAFGKTIDLWETSDLIDLWVLQAFTSPAQAKTSALRAQITAPSRLTYTGNTARIAGDPRYLFFYGDETIDTAEVLLAHARLGGDKEFARALALGLANASQKGWYVTPTMMSVATGLKNFAAKYETEAVRGSAVVAVKEENASASVDFDKSQEGSLKTAWNSDKANVTVNHAGSGQPWMSLQTLAAVPLTAPRGQGLSVEKTVRNMTRGAGYQAGDLIEVTLTISASSSMTHVAMHDPIPAGANIMGEAYGSYSAGEKSYAGYKLYFTVLPIGTISVKYQYQLNNPGQFKMPPTRVEGLYMPGVYGEAPNATITVE